MPELPEVETIRRGLQPHLEGRRITRVALNRAGLRFAFPQRLKQRLEGAGIGALDRRAKYLLVALDRGETLVIHLGMSGRLLILSPEMAGRDDAAVPGHFHREITRLVQHDHLEIDFDSGMRLIFNDPRRFGFVLLEPSETLSAHPLFTGLGPEPLGNGFSAQMLLARFAKRRMPVKAALLDQRTVAGLGNIYVCEALHRAHIAPERLSGTLSEAEALALVRAIRAVLAEAIEAGGSSLRDYRHQDGSLGYFQHAFRVYDRAGSRCPTPGCAGSIERIVQSGRSSFFCRVCQG